MSAVLTAASPAADDRLDGLAAVLLRRGQLDPRTLDRARRVAAESGQRLDAVLIQLGLITERALAEACAELLGLALVAPARYPAEPLFADRLTARFLRAARLMPVALDGETLVVATADPLDDFSPGAIAAATGRAVRRESPSRSSSTPPSTASTPTLRPKPPPRPPAPSLWKRTPSASRTWPARPR